MTEVECFRLVAKWTINEVFALLNARKISAKECPVSPEATANLLKLIVAEKISWSAAKRIFVVMADTGEGAIEVAERLGLWQINDRTVIEGVVQAVLNKYPEQVRTWRAMA